MDEERCPMVINLSMLLYFLSLRNSIQMYASRGLRDDLGDSPKQRVNSLGQNPKALVFRWRRIRTLKFNILTINALISTNKVFLFKLTIKACS